MANAEKYANWIVNNADKKGTPEFETVKQAYQAAKIDYQKLETQKQKNDKLRQELKGQSWAERNIRGAATAPSNLIEGVKQGAYDISNPQQYINPKTGEISVIPYEGYQALPRKQYDTSQIQRNRVIAGESPIGAIAGNIATAVPLAFIPGVNRTAGSMLAGGTLSALQPTLGSESRAENAITGALTSGIVPNAPKITSNILSSGANRLMMSALKPGKKELESGAGQRAVKTMLEEGVNPTVGRTIFGRGLDTLQSKVDSLNTQIKDMISNSTAKVSKAKVLSYLDDLENSYKFQFAPDADVAAVQAVRKQFEKNPLLPKAQTTGLIETITPAADEFPVQLAQKIKQGTYKSIGEKNFAELGGATKEAQRAGAKGLKEEIARVEPQVNLLNAKESDLINALDVAESRAYTALKNNPGGIAGLANSPTQFALMMADRSDAFKALMARIMYQGKKGLELIPSVKNVGLLGVPASQVTNVTKEPREQ